MKKQLVFGLAALSLVAVASAASAASAQTDPAIRPVECGDEHGTAFATNDNRFTTAAHVAREGNCQLSPAQPLRVMDYDDRRDYARGRTATFGGNLRVSCEPIVGGQQYILVGYPAGTNEERRVFARATGEVHNIRQGNLRLDGLVSLRGVAVRGMSGGPVLNQSGDVVGIISSVSTSARLTLVQPIINTDYCPGNG
jgi:hypothetical protein